MHAYTCICTDIDRYRHDLNMFQEYVGAACLCSSAVGEWPGGHYPQAGWRPKQPRQCSARRALRALAAAGSLAVLVGTDWACHVTDSDGQGLAQTAATFTARARSSGYPTTPSQCLRLARHGCQCSAHLIIVGSCFQVDMYRYAQILTHIHGYTQILTAINNARRNVCTVRPLSMSMGSNLM